MVSLLLAAHVADGHVAPMLGVAEHLVGAGHRVRFLTGDRFADAVRGAGAEFLRWPGAAHLDHRDVIAEVRGSGDRRGGTKGIVRDVEQIFIAPAHDQYAAMRAAIEAERTDAVLTDFTVVGAGALALSPDPRPPIVACGILPLGLTSVDTAPWGLGILPRHDAIGRARNRLLNRMARHVILRRPQRQVEQFVRRETGAELDVFFMDWALRADHYVQFTVPGFEYARRDLAPTVSFVGPVSRPPRRVTLPGWWPDLDSGRPVVHVSQGTVANSDPGELIIPTIRALADRDVLVVVTTGDAPVASLGALPPNARAEAFISYDALMPKVDVFVTNGGYGGLHHALAHGVPMVVAGDTEDKVETTRRVEWSGSGVNLHTGRPREDAIAAAVDKVLREPSYRECARALESEVAAAPGAAGVERIMLGLVASRA
ncbi:glycosyltransferase [Microbacterium sp. SD291]|uniref:glycosyltransferase n=1 Tax=Microbacterium sp. SD291 TaxID=2782007 RepID=UPI001A97AB4F|nr:nucleotide disphospho-sugar-binding domain-containing protein [Microbacterium sp. SD291]MBO0980785.1 glycosyltransferase [Microbacterium sp. SD291]